MKTSLDKIFSQFGTFATNHNQISSFYTKPLTENTAKGLIYPMLWIDVQAVSVSFQRGQAIITLPTLILDRVERDFSNIISVLSSTLLTINDFLIYYSDIECTYGFYFSDNSSASPVIYEFDDLVCGWNMNISCQIMDSRDTTKIPFNS